MYIFLHLYSIKNLYNFGIAQVHPFSQTVFDIFTLILLENIVELLDEEKASVLHRYN